MERDDRRHIDHRRVTVGEHFALEAPALRPLPAEPFDTTALSSHRVDARAGCRCVARATRFPPVMRAGELMWVSAPSGSRCSMAPSVAAVVPIGAQLECDQPAVAAAERPSSSGGGCARGGWVGWSPVDVGDDVPVGGVPRPLGRRVDGRATQPQSTVVPTPRGVRCRPRIPDCSPPRSRNAGRRRLHPPSSGRRGSPYETHHTNIGAHR